MGLCLDCPRPHRLFASFPGRPAGAASCPQSHGVGVKTHRGQQDDGAGLNPFRPTTFPLYDGQYKGQFHSLSHPSRFSAAHSDGCGSSSSAVLPSLSPQHISGVRLRRPNGGSPVIRVNKQEKVRSNATARFWPRIRGSAPSSAGEEGMTGETLRTAASQPHCAGATRQESSSEQISSAPIAGPIGAGGGQHSAPQHSVRGGGAQCCGAGLCQGSAVRDTAPMGRRRSALRPCKHRRHHRSPFPGVRAAPAAPVPSPCNAPSLPRAGDAVRRAPQAGRSVPPPPSPNCPGGSATRTRPPHPPEKGDQVHARPTGGAAPPGPMGRGPISIRSGPARPGPAALSGPGGAQAWRHLSAPRARLERGGRNEPQPHRRRMEP